MKYNNKFRVFILAVISIVLISCGTTLPAADKAKKAQLIESKIKKLDFKFLADFAYPISYPSFSLSPHYKVTVSPDTVISYLPYFGQAYRIPIDTSEGGIKFESTNFESDVRRGKKDGLWYVTICIRSSHRPITMFFHIWDNGKAQLNVSDQDRQPISFSGTIEVEDTEKHKKPK